MNFMMKGKRILSLLLAIVLVFCVIPPQTMAVEGNENDASVIGKAVKINSNFGGTIRFAPGDATYYFYVASYFPKVMDIVAVEEVGGVTYYQVKAAANFTWSPNATYTEYDADIWIKSTEVDFVQPCDKCGKLDCDKVHVFCPYCAKYDCGLEHNDPYQPYSAPVIAENPTLTPGADVSLVDEWGNPVTDSFVVQAGEKYSLSAWPALEGEVSYQWQVCYNNAQMLWVDIYGQTNKGILVNASMFRSLVDAQGMTYLRCVTTNGSQTMTSEPIAVLLDETASQEPVATYNARSARYANSARSVDLGDDAQTVDEEVKHSITIKYVMKVEGVEAPSPWVVYLAPGENYVVNVKPDDVTGFYAGDAAGERIEYVNETISNIQQDHEITVYYWPDYTKFKVQHYQQKVGDDSYELFAEETFDKKLKTGEMVGAALAKPYKGFDVLPYDTTITVAADGSTVVKIYYDRQYYMIAIDLNGGYGAEPIYARFGTPVSIPNPKRTGYTFAGWENEASGQIEPIVATVPDQRMNYKARWDKANTKFTVAFWYENANDDNYTFVGSVQLDGKTGLEVSGESYVSYNDPASSVQFGGFKADYAKHFQTLNTDKSDKKVILEADGSTVINLYFYRNSYTLKYLRKQCVHTHGNGCTYICGKVAHSHTHEACCSNQSGFLHFTHGYDACKYKEKNGGPNGKEGTHTHDASCCSHQNVWDCPCRKTASGWYEVYNKKHKFEADVSAVHGKMEDLGNGARWIPADQKAFPNWSTDGYGGGTAIGTFTAMPGCDLTFNEGQTGGNYYEITYWLETYDGSGTKNYKGKNFAQGTTFTVRMGHVAYLDEFTNGMPQGYERYYATYGSSFGDDSGGTIPEGGLQSAYQYNNFYYIRETFKLEYVNLSDVVETAILKYNQPLTAEYNIKLPSTAVSPYGAGYEFSGWYLDPECTVSVDWNNTRMPDGGTSGNVGLRVYAKWEPIKHEVKTYLTKDHIGGTPINTYSILHGEMYEGTVAIPDNGGLNFIGWFYEEDGKEVAYDFSMPVYRNMNLYAKWNSSVVTYGTIYYMDTAGNQLAEPVRITGMVGDTKTYNAKFSAELGDGSTLYFPDTTSHNIKFTANPDQNVHVFVYKALPEVKYTIKFVNKDNPSQELFPAVSGSAKTATISHTSPAKDKWYVDKNSKEFALSSDESKNVFYFYYTYDPGKATVQVEHYIENLAGTGYDFHSETPATVEELESMIVAANRKVTINGFTYSKATFNGVEAEQQMLTGGLTLKLYYTRNEYSYTFKFVYMENGVQKEFAGSAVTGTAKYRKNIMQEAKKFTGYKPDAGAKSIIVDYNESNNTYTFYYTEEGVNIRYSVGAVKGGSIDSTGETVNAITGIPNGSTATVKNNLYIFTGWYMDYNCTQKVGWETDEHIIPQKSDGIYEADTYYAGFKEVQADIYYQVVMPTGAPSATLTTPSEKVDIITGIATGSGVATIPAGYEFAGWYSDADCTQQVSENQRFVPTRPGQWANTQTYYAKFVEKKATIRYEVIGPGSVTSSKETLEMITGTATGSTAAAIENYGKFVGWYDANGILLSMDANYKPTMPAGGWAEEQTFYAKFELVEYTITIVDRGETVGAMNYTAGLNLALPGRTNGNYRLSWKVTNTDGNWTTELLNEFLNGAPIECYGNVTIEAVWTIDVYWIDWNVDLSKPETWGLLDQQLNVPFGTEHIYNGELPTREDPEGKYTYTFNGWVEVDLSYYEALLGEKINGIIVYQAVYTSTANSASLTIKVAGCEEELDPNQSFLFTVTGEGVNLKVGVVENGFVTIDGLTIGKEYTITIDNDWSWRYESKQDQISAAKDTDGAKTANSIKVTLEEGEVVTFTVTRENQWWLDGWWTGLLNKN